MRAHEMWCCCRQQRTLTVKKSERPVTLSPSLSSAAARPTLSRPLTSDLCVSLPQMDPVQKAVINHTFGVTLVPKKKQIISCNVCQLRFNSDVSVDVGAGFNFGDVIPQTIPGSWDWHNILLCDP